MNKRYFIDKLTRNKPTNLELYNYDLLPPTFLHNDKLPINCKKHGLFYQTAYNHLFGSECPDCGIEKRTAVNLLGTEKFIERSKNKYGNKFDYSKTIYVGRRSDLTITCPQHGDFINTAFEHFRLKLGCPKCEKEARTRLGFKRFLKQAEKVHGDEYDYSKTVFDGFSRKIEIICKTHGSFWQNPSSHITSQTNCPICASEKQKLTLDIFISKSKAIHGDAFDYSKVMYETNMSMVTITCKKHGDFIQRANSHLNGCGCKLCFLEGNKKSTKKFIEDARLVHGDKYDYSRVNYKTNKEKVEIICPIHGSFWQKPNSHLSTKSGCLICCESKGEIAVEKFLQKHNIVYIREYKIMPYNYRYDFHLPELNVFIEFHGLQHYVPVNAFGGEEAFCKVVKNDNIKQELVKVNGGRLIVVNHSHLTNKTVESALIGHLKNAYAYWFVIDGELKVFKYLFNVIKTFGLPSNTSTKNVRNEVAKRVSSFQELF